MAILSKVQGVRDFDGALFQLAKWVAGDRNRQALLVMLAPGMSPDRLKREWDSDRALMQKSVAHRIGLVILGMDVPWAKPVGGWLDFQRLQRVLGTTIKAKSPMTSLTPKFFEVFKVIMVHWFRKAGPISLGQIQGESGSSYPTVAHAVKKLETRRELTRKSRRRIELSNFPRETWSEVVALSNSLRKPVRFVDGTGRPPDVFALMRRLERLAPSGIAWGGVTAARHYDKKFNLNGTPRLDICMQGDMNFIRELDPALQEITGEGFPVLVVHPLHRPHPMYEKTSKLPVADPVETLLDLHEMRLYEQSDDLIRRLTNA